ncbi:TPA: hypothetical protein ACSP3X_003404 [Aeromonas hydrophila]
MALRDKEQNKVRFIKEEYAQRFRTIQSSGSKPSHPGIYECQTCGFEDLINRECNTLPPCSKCDGSEWKLIAFAQDSEHKGRNIY